MPEDEDSDAESLELQPATPSPIQIASRAIMSIQETTPSTVMEQVEDAPAELHASTLNEVIDRPALVRTLIDRSFTITTHMIAYPGWTVTGSHRQFARHLL